MPSSTCCELQQTRWYYSGVISSLMRPDYQLRAFNAEVTASPRIAPPPCPHNCPIMLVLLFWDDWEGCFEWCAAFSFHDTGSPRTGRSLAIPPSSFGHSLFILGHFSLLVLSLGSNTQMGRSPQSLGPTITPQNPTVRLIGRR